MGDANADQSETGSGPEASEDDRSLLAALRAGEDGAWESLWRRHYPGLRRYAAAQLRSDTDAEDVASEALTRTLARFSTAEAPGSLSGYLRAVARHLIVDLFRLRERELQLAERISRDAELARHAGLGIDERRQVVQALRRMQARQRYVLIRVIVDGLSIPEVADEMELTPNATHQLALRARRAFRRIFGEAFEVRSAVGAARRAWFRVRDGGAAPRTGPSRDAPRRNREARSPSTPRTGVATT